jgi:hypothetical protein
MENVHELSDFDQKVYFNTLPPEYRIQINIGIGNTHNLGEYDRVQFHLNARPYS